MIHEVLCHGEENAIPGQALVKILGLRDIRDVSQIVERERKAGFPICATTNRENPGYYLAENAGEFEAYIKSLDRRLLNMRKTREACQNTLDRMTGQLHV